MAEMSTARRHATNFLLPVDPRSSLLRIGKRLISEAGQNENVRTRLDTIQAKLGDGRPIIDEQQSAIFERIVSPSEVPDIPTAPEWLRPLIAVAYLRAKGALARGGASTLFDDLEGSLDRVTKMLEQVESEFIGELLVETVLAAKEDPLFAQTLHQAAAEFRVLVDEVYGSQEQSSVAFAAAPSAPGAQGSCQACRTINGRRECTPISCWVIVVIVIVVIVTK